MSIQNFTLGLLLISATSFADTVPTTIDANMEDALDHMRRSEYVTAEPLLRTAIDQITRAREPDHRLGPLLNDLGAVLYYTSRIAEAEQCYLKARVEMRSSADRDYASLLNNLGTLYRGTGALQKAEAVHKEALHIHERVLGRESPEVARDLEYLADLHLRAADYSEAENEARRSVAILSGESGVDQLLYGDALQCLASVLEAESAFTEAEALEQRALDLRESSLGRDHPRTANSLAGLASLRLRQHRYAEADDLIERALSIWNKHPQEHEAKIGAALNNLAQIAKATGRLGEAERLYRNALET